MSIVASSNFTSASMGEGPTWQAVGVPRGQKTLRTAVFCYFAFRGGLGLLIRRFRSVPVHSGGMVRNQESPGRIERVGRNVCFFFACQDRCLSRMSFREKDAPQWTQENGRSPVCLRICRLRLAPLVKAWGHKWHWYGRLCLLMCTVKSFLMLVTYVHRWQQSSSPGVVVNDSYGCRLSDGTESAMEHRACECRANKVVLISWHN